jgi:hypothetical protein
VQQQQQQYRVQVPGTRYRLPPPHHQYHENVRPNPRAVGSIDVSIYAASPPSCAVYLYIIYFIQSCFYYYINAVRLTSAPSPPTDASHTVIGIHYTETATAPNPRVHSLRVLRYSVGIIIGRLSEHYYTLYTCYNKSALYNVYYG